MSLTVPESQVPETIRRPADMPKIFGAMARVKREMPAVPKAHQTESGAKYAYRSAEDVVNAASPLFAREGVLVVPYIDRASREIRERANGSMAFSIMEVTFTFYAEDGSFITCKVIGEASDVSDKASTKAQTVAERIAICKILSIPTKETNIDPEGGPQNDETTHGPVERATTAMRGAKDTAVFKKVLTYVLKCCSGKGDERDRISKDSVPEMRLVALEVAKRFRIAEEGTQWIDDQFNAILNAVEPTEESQEPQMEVEPVRLSEVTDLLAGITEQNAEEVLRQVVVLYPQMSLEDQDKVREIAQNFEHPAYRLWVGLEIAVADEISGEIRSIAAMESSGLIEKQTKVILTTRGQVRLSQLKKGKR